ncbi:MAG TPA: hypothetical protein VFG74_11810 [Miltoncostaeaceae bacterium]|jgi:hypothetical protein|nr:hypothetical protein [Miltoncostaeaceae bacterium]
MRKANWWIGATVGMAVGLAGVAIADQASQPAEAATFQLTPAQLQINQRISQAAVRRSNESLNLLDPIRKSGARDDAPGWGTAQIKDGAVTTAKLDTATRERIPRWAVVAATSGTLVRGHGATTSTKSTDPGIYTVTWDRDVSACSIQATQGDGGTTPVTTPAHVTAWRSATDAKVVTVRTAVDDPTATPATYNTPSNTVPFTVTVLC